MGIAEPGTVWQATVMPAGVGPERRTGMPMVRIPSVTVYAAALKDKGLFVVDDGQGGGGEGADGGGGAGRHDDRLVTFGQLVIDDLHGDGCGGLAGGEGEGAVGEGVVAAAGGGAAGDGVGDDDAGGEVGAGAVDGQVEVPLGTFSATE